MAREPLDTLAAVRAAGKTGVARTLTAIETAAGEDWLAALLDEAVANATGYVLGLTGPPGVGKSTLTSALVATWRGEGLSVAVLAVDPSSRRSGGALLGDRTRMKTDPADESVFIRSMAARDRLGGLSDHSIAAVALLRAVYDMVLVETVGIGQSEGDIALVADTIVLCVQPGSGDSLQFMKAGIMELPDIVAVTKADMGDVARRAAADVEGALSLNHRAADDWPVPVVQVSATAATGVGGLVEAVRNHRDFMAEAGRLDAHRDRLHERWIREAVRESHGRTGLRQAEGLLSRTGHKCPFAAINRVAEALEGRPRLP